jgi:hypothetical protein
MEWYAQRTLAGCVASYVMSLHGKEVHRLLVV